MKKTLIAASLAGLMLMGSTFASDTGMNMPGSDRDAHGCIGSAGYIWSDTANKCVRPWENQEIVTTQDDTEDTAIITRGYNTSITKYSTWDSFMPNAPLTRQQAAKMIAMWIGQNANIVIEGSDVGCRFTDEKEIDPTLTDWVRVACTYGLFKGYKGNFMPNNNITTNDILTVVQRLSDKSPVINSYTSLVKIKVADRPLLRVELLKGLYILDGYVKEQATIEAANQMKAAQDKLNAAKTLWTSQNLSTYTLTQRISCFCAPDYTRPVEYNVTNNSIDTTGANYADGSGEVISGAMAPTLHTINQAFTMIQEAIDNKSDSVTVEYDSKLGYPTSIAIDRSRMIADEEQYYTFSLVK